MSDVPRETAEKLARFAQLVTEENCRQNLVAASTIATMHERHIDDSLQLLEHAPPGHWLDIGTGGGFPGMVVAIARAEPITLVEPRARRAAFLQSVADQLALHHVTVVQTRVEMLAPVQAKIISARAVASLPDLLKMAHRHAAPDCTWLLPKGRSSTEELAAARIAWQGDFKLIPSRTDPEASIVMIRDLKPRAPRGKRP